MSLRIAIADDEPCMREFFCRVLVFFGHDITVAAENGRQLVEGCRNSQPDLIITDLAMPMQDGLEAVHEICTERPVPAIIVSGLDIVSSLPRICCDPVFAILVKPVRMDDLPPAIMLAMRRFDQDQMLRHELTRLRQQLSGKA